jgi:hypothetical protein
LAGDLARRVILLLLMITFKAYLLVEDMHPPPSEDPNEHDTFLLVVGEGEDKVSNTKILRFHR